jgi:hypothetical protein
LEHAHGPLTDRARRPTFAVKSERLPLEYYWTCGPAFLLHVFQRAAQVEMLAYVDADMFFFGDPAPIYRALGNRSILVKEQRVSPVGDNPRGGKYNVGVLVFRRTNDGMACLIRWRAQCLEWCFDRFEPERHGDQKYLDDWPERFNAVVVRHAGVGLAPWHVGQVEITFREGQVLIERDPLICYHFARVRRINRWIYEMHDTRFHRAKASPIVRRHIYAPYLRELYAAEQRLRTIGGRIHSGTVRAHTPGEIMRRTREADASRTSPLPHHRFMFVSGSIVV